MNSNNWTLVDLWTYVCVTDISEVKGDLKITPEEVWELRVHVQHLQHILSVDLMKVAVRQSSNISVWLPRTSVQVEGLTEYIVFPCDVHKIFFRNIL